MSPGGRGHRADDPPVQEDQRGEWENSWWSTNIQNLLKLLRSTITSGVRQNLLKLLLVVDNYFGRSTFCCLRCLMGVFGCLDNCELRGALSCGHNCNFIEIFLQYFYILSSDCFGKWGGRFDVLPMTMTTDYDQVASTYHNGFGDNVWMSLRFVLPMTIVLMTM